MLQCLRGKQRLKILFGACGPVHGLGFGGQSSLRCQQKKSGKGDKGDFQVCSG